MGIRDILCTTCCLLLALIAGASCVHDVPPTDAQRAQSLAAFGPATVGQQPLTTYIRQRTGMLISGTATVAAVYSQDNNLSISLTPAPNTTLENLARAVAIERDGYFLTSAHCTGPTNLYLAFYDGKTTQLALARVVARRFDPRNEIDFAVLHVDARLSNVFEWADIAQVKVGDEALAVGVGSMVATSPQSGYFPSECIAGHITRLRQQDRAYQIEHDLPGRQGDSGGPLVDRAGRLLGITRGVRVTWPATRTAISLRPDLEWLKRAIDADRNAIHLPHVPLPLQPRDERPVHLMIGL
jgi:S1-C subfamily serine protease